MTGGNYWNDPDQKAAVIDELQDASVDVLDLLRAADYLSKPGCHEHGTGPLMAVQKAALAAALRLDNLINDLADREGAA
jgi:hypothetical protein